MYAIDHFVTGHIIICPIAAQVHVGTLSRASGQAAKVEAMPQPKQPAVAVDDDDDEFDNDSDDEPLPPKPSHPPQAAPKAMAMPAAVAPAPKQSLIYPCYLLFRVSDCFVRALSRCICLCTCTGRRT
jgi:hypothetical protein